jgi:AraC family transcriptional regulator
VTATRLVRGEFLGRRKTIRQLGHFTLSLTDYAGGSELPWHAHDETYLTFVIRGAYRELLRGAARDCTPRALVVHPAGEHHADHFGGAARCMNVELDRAWLSALAARGDAFARPALVDVPSVAAIGAHLLRELNDLDALSPLVIEGLLLELFVEIARHGHTAQRAPAWLRAVRELVAARFAENLTLHDLGTHFDVHPAHLARAFRQHYGCTLGDFVRDQRVEEAKRRITAGAALSEVALDCGFADQSHLARTFRRITGQTPSEFRRAR